MDPLIPATVPSGIVDLVSAGERGRENLVMRIIYTLEGHIHTARTSIRRSCLPR